MSATSLAQEAYVAVARALQNGTLVRPDRCPKCHSHGRDKGGRARIHAHHDDYSKPLDVMWLCPPCHRARHRELGWGCKSPHSQRERQTGQMGINFDKTLFHVMGRALPALGDSEYYVDWLIAKSHEYLRTNAERIAAAGVRVPKTAFRK